MEEWFEFIQDFVSEGNSERYSNDTSDSGDVIEIDDDPNQPQVDY